MDFQSLLSFNGRQRRLHFWLIAIAIAVVNGIVSSLTWQKAYMAQMMGGHAAWGPVALIGVVISLGLFYLSLANSVKRLHDRDKNWWWLLLMYAACLTIVGILWPLIELGFLDGTPGPNRFGPSPKGVGGPAPATA
jgi:uncharacterized membrane protein YhaH (DUF805 family)